MSKTTTSWSLQEKIRLLELFMNKDILWEQRVIILQKEFAQRPATFFSVQNVRQELHQIFMSPNPEHVYGLPLHSRGKEAAEMWVKHFRKEQIKQRELQKQMFLVSMRRQLDLIKRFQQGKLPSKEIEAILTETRERDAQLPERDLYESAVAQTLNKLRLDDLNNIRSFADYYSFLRGERVPTPSPEPLRLKSSTPVRLTTASIASSELVLKDIKNNASSTVQHKEKSPSSNTSSTCTFFGNSKQNEQVPELGDFLDDEEEKEEENKTNNDNNCSLEIKNQVIALNKEGEIDLNKVAKRTIILEENNDVVFDGEQGTDLGESPDKSNIFAEEIEEDNETIKSVQRKDLNLSILNEEEINILLSEDGDNSIKIIDKSSIKVRVDDELEGDDENIKNNQNSKGKSNSVEDNELIIENIDKGNDDKNGDKNDLVEKIIAECFEECFNETCLRKTEKTEKTVAEMIWSCSSIEYAQLSTFESTIKKMNQTFQLVKNMDGQESNSFVENICKIAQFDSVEEKIVLLPSNQSNSLEEPMTSVKAAHIISSEIEVANSIKEQQLKRQQRNKTLPKKLQQKLPLITKPSLSRNLRSSTTKKKEEKEEVLITTEELEGINQNIEVEEVTPPPPSAVIVGSKKRKRTEIDLLKPPLQPDNVEQQPEGVGGPPAKNLRRSSYSSPFSHSSESKSSLVTKKEVQKESISSVSDVVKSQPILSPIEQEAPILPIKPIPSPLQLSIQPLHSHVAATAKLRSSLRRAALASSTPSPAVDSVGTNGLFLRPGNHSSTEIIPKQVLLTLLRDISSHRHCYIFEKPVEEEEVPGYHSAIKKPMDLQTLHQLIESCAIQTFGQFTHHILLIYANAVMYNSTGHHVNTCAKEMLDFAFKCIEVVQYPSGQWPPPLHIPATPALATSVSRQSIASESDGPNDGQLSRSSSGISCSQIPSTSNTTTKTLASTQQKILRSSSTSKGNKIKSINSSASSSASSYSSETKKEQEDQEQPSIPKIELMTKKITGSSRRKLHR